jgi:SAM-dependent methyltransferase
MDLQNDPFGCAASFESLFRKNVDLNVPSNFPGFRDQVIKYFHDHKGVMNHPQETQYFRACSVIESELETGRLSVKDISGRIFDFGCGEGGSSIFFSQFSEKVKACELLDFRLEQLGRTKLLRKPDVLLGDGMQYLTNAEEGSFDFIAAFYFGEMNVIPYYIQRFMDAASHALAPNGKIIFTDNLASIDHARRILSIRYNTEYNPRTIIIDHHGAS